MIDRQFAKTREEVDAALQLASLEAFCGFDTEGASLDQSSTVAGFSLYLPKNQKSYYFPFCHPDFQCPIEEQQRIAQEVAKLKVKTYNGGHDLLVWELHYNCVPKIVGDAAISTKMFQLHMFGLKKTCLQLGIVEKVIGIEDVLGLNCFDFTKALLTNPLVLPYTCQDAELAVAFEEYILKEHLNRDKYKAWDFIYELEADISLILTRAGFEGIPIDRDKFKVAISEMSRDADKLHKEVCSLLNRNPDTFKINSHQKLGAALYHKPDYVPAQEPRTVAQREIMMPGLGLICPGQKSSVSVDVLEQLEQDHPVIEKIIEWKHLNAVITRDVPQVERWASSGVLHPSYLPIGDDGTSRIYAVDPSITSISMVARGSMIPEPGTCYAHVDYSAAEWRICALASGETKILDALENGLDAHKFTFSQMTGVPYDQVTKEQREIGKVCNYAPLYGTTPWKLAQTLGCPESEAVGHMEKFWLAYPNLKKWIDATREFATKHGRTETLYGRHRKLPGIFTTNKKLKLLEQRKAVNTAGQGTCGDVLKVALRNINKEIKSPESALARFGAKIKVPVFDAVLLSFNLEAFDKKEEVEKAVREACEVTLGYQGRETVMRCTVGWSKNSWREACGK